MDAIAAESALVAAADTGQLWAQLALARFHVDRGDAAGAAALERLRRQHPLDKGDGASWLQAELAAALQGASLAAAVEQLLKADQPPEVKARGICALGLVLEAQHDWRRARTLFHHARLLAPLDAVATVLYARALVHAEPQEAGAALALLADVDPAVLPPALLESHAFLVRALGKVPGHAVDVACRGRRGRLQTVPGVAACLLGHVYAVLPEL